MFLPSDQKPLAPAELARLRIWHRNMMLFYAAAMTVIIGAALLLPRIPQTTWAPRATLAVLAVLIVAGAIVQFRERCPRCLTRIGRQSRFVLPRQCRKCGVPFVATDA